MGLADGQAWEKEFGWMDAKHKNEMPGGKEAGPMGTDNWNTLNRNYRGEASGAVLSAETHMRQWVLWAKMPWDKEYTQMEYVKTSSRKSSYTWDELQELRDRIDAAVTTLRPDGLVEYRIESVYVKVPGA